jgi:hypothetical protein
MESFDTLFDDGRDHCDGDIDAVAFSLKANSILGELRAIGSDWIKIPISPFFLSSFAVTLVFYLGVVITWFVLWIDRITAQFFSNKYLRTGKYPFTFVSAFAFVLVEILRGVLYIFNN